MGAASANRSLERGDLLLGVELVELVARGRRGSVWRARDADGRIVVLKALGADAGSSDAEAFRRGVIACNRLALEDEDGQVPVPRPLVVELDQLAMVQEHVPNGDASGIPALGWDTPRILELFLELCHGVAALHRLGMIHGALKPSNVLIDADLAPVLSDPQKFAAHEPGSRVDTVDATYRAPEALGGSAADVPAADIYSLGQLLTFFLAGGDTAGALDAVQALRQRTTSAPGLVQIVRKATAENPEVRYPSVDDLIADVERYQHPQDVGLVSTNPAVGRTTRDVIVLPASPATPAGIASPRVPGPAATEATARHYQGLSRGVELGIGLVGVAVAAAAMLIVTATPLPSVRAAAVFGMVLTASLALATFLVKGPRANPALWRLLLASSALLVYPLADPGSLVALRWERTLRNGGTAERAAAATRLIRTGHFDLSGAKLARANLVGANLSEADLSSADLAGADLTEASLVEANLAGATVRGANLAGADLVGSTIARATDFASTRCDAATNMPERWTCAQGRPQRAEAGDGIHATRQ